MILIDSAHPDQQRRFAEVPAWQQLQAQLATLSTGWQPVRCGTRSQRRPRSVPGRVRLAHSRLGLILLHGSAREECRAATRGLAQWLASRYGLNAAEIATVLANTVHYDIAEVVDPHVHVVAKIRKDVLRDFDVEMSSRCRSLGPLIARQVAITGRTCFL
jgi:hypothetical protein